MTLPARPTEPSPSVPATAVLSSLAFLGFAVLLGGSMQLAAALVVVATVIALVRPGLIRWPQLVAALIVIIMFIPIRRYTLPASLPFQLEPYRVFVALLILGWFASMLVDPRTTFRRTGFEGPLVVIVGAAIASIVANPTRVAHLSTFVNKDLMFFLSFVLVLFLVVSVIRRLEEVDLLASTLVVCGTVVAISAVVEARTGFNVFNHLSRVIPFLHGGAISGPEFIRFGTARLRVFGSAEHPIALGAALVMLVPLSIYLARCRSRRWIVCALVLSVGAISTVSRTGIVMFVVIGLVFLWLRPRETRRLWPALIPALVVIHLAVPGTLGSIKNSFMPPGGLVAEQESQAGQSGSGRLADLGRGIADWKHQPLVGQGFGTRVVESADSTSINNNILDDQWLGTLLETGALGFAGWLWFFWRAVRRFGAEAKRDDTARGWLLVSITASVAAYAVGMSTYDAFSFIQVTFLLFILVGLGSGLVAERSAAVRPLTEVRRRPEPDRL